MKHSFFLSLKLCFLAGAVSFGQSNFPKQPQGLITVFSERWPGAEISYKETSICETTEGVKAWSGYVSLPSSVINQVEHAQVLHDMNIFFWYFESRKDPQLAPTAIFLGGGPGHTSLDAASGFPCLVNDDSNSTTLNPNSWNKEVNMLYIEQPAGTGFSYSQLANGTLHTTQDDASQFVPLSKDRRSLPPTNATVLAATLDSLSAKEIQNTTAQAARTMWQFAQVWFQEFPERHTSDNKISFWGNSYGGYWTAGFSSYILEQNQLISTGKHTLANATALDLGVVGIINGCVDAVVSASSYPHLAYNNTYDMALYSEKQYQEQVALLNDPKQGCFHLAEVCRALSAEGDPYGLGTNATVNTACQAATGICLGKIVSAFPQETERSQFDITQPVFASEVPLNYISFFNQDWVQRDLGVPLNFTSDDYAYQTAFLELTGDPILRSLSSLEHILEQGAEVALVFGDRDYQCNWIGGENISLALSWNSSSSFRAAGYTDLVTNTTYNGGKVRQFGALSFSRIFEAGHAATYFQPETVYQTFHRAMFGNDIATGKVKVSSNYSTKGPDNTWNVKNKVPARSKQNICYIYSAADSCTPDQIKALNNGSAVVHNFVVTDPQGITIANTAMGDDTQPTPTATSEPGSQKKSLGSRTGGSFVTVAAVFVLHFVLCL